MPTFLSLKGKTRKEKFLAMCESEADATTCFARFRACKSFVVGRIALPLTVLSNIMKSRISSARACVKVFQSFSS